MLGIPIPAILLMLIYLLLLVFFRSGFKKVQPGCGQNSARISVVVPARNESLCLPNLLEALAQQSYSTKNYEIILIDDRSTDSTYELMAAFAKHRQHVCVIRIVDCPQNVSSKKNALFQGIKQAQYEIILTTDADTLPGPDWIRSIAAYYSGEQQVDVVLGYAAYKTSPPFDTLFHKLLALEYFSLASVALASVAHGFPSTSSGANLSYRKTLFEQVGGFGESMRFHSGDDDLLIHRFKEKTDAGFRYAIGNDAVVHTDPPKNLKQFFHQRIRFASKHLAYPGHVVFVLTCVYLFHCLLLLLLGLALFIPRFRFMGCVFLVIKTMADLWFLYPAQQKLEKRNLLPYYPLAVLPHIIYVVIFPLLGQLMPKRW